MNNGVAQVFYFDEQATPLRVSDVVSIWSTLSVLRNSVKVRVYRDEQDTQGNCRRIQSGDADGLGVLLPAKEAGFWGDMEVLTRERREINLFDTEFAFGAASASRWLGIDTLRNTCLYLSETMYEKIGLPAFMRVLEEHFRGADRNHALYGCVDVALADHLFSGMAFESIVILQMPTYRWAEQAKWVCRSPRAEFVRGLYWGNYFGQRMLDKLNAVCEGDFLEAYRGYACDIYGQSTAITWKGANGVFVSICPDPSDCFFGKKMHTATEWNIIWLTQKLAAANLL